MFIVGSVYFTALYLLHVLGYIKGKFWFLQKYNCTSNCSEKLFKPLLNKKSTSESVLV